MSLLSEMSASDYLQEVNKENFSLIHYMAVENNYDAMDRMSQLPYFKDIVNVEGEGETDEKKSWTPLLVSIRANPNGANFDMLDLLVDNGADILKAKGDGVNAMHFAASNNDVHLIDYIFQRKPQGATNAEIANTPHNGGYSPTYFACFLENFDSLNLLMENGGDPNIMSAEGLTGYQEIIN